MSPGSFISFGKVSELKKRVGRNSYVAVLLQQDLQRRWFSELIEDVSSYSQFAYLLKESLE